MALVVIRLIYVGFTVCRSKRKKKGAGDHMGVGYCPFPALSRDTTLVSQQEGRGVRDRKSVHA